MICFKCKAGALELTWLIRCRWLQGFSVSQISWRPVVIFYWRVQSTRRYIVEWLQLTGRISVVLCSRRKSWSVICVPRCPEIVLGTKHYKQAAVARFVTKSACLVCGFWSVVSAVRLHLPWSWEYTWQVSQVTPEFWLQILPKTRWDFILLDVWFAVFYFETSPIAQDSPEHTLSTTFRGDKHIGRNMDVHSCSFLE